MTAIGTRPIRDTTGDALLRVALRADAPLCGALGLLVVMAVVLVAGWLPLTGFGAAVTIAFTAVTVVFAYGQYLGVRRLGAPPS